MREKRFHDLVAAWLAKSFAEVEHEVTLDQSNNRVDFIAYTPYESYVIEVENDWSTIYNGIGQARLYSSETDFQPVVFFPADEVDPVEMELLRNDDDAPIIETV